MFFPCFHSNFALCLIADVHIQIHAVLPSLSCSAYSCSPTLLQHVTQDEKGFRKMKGTLTSQPLFHPQSGWPHYHLQFQCGHQTSQHLQRMPGRGISSVPSTDRHGVKLHKVCLSDYCWLDVARLDLL